MEVLLGPGPIGFVLIFLSFRGLVRHAQRGALGPSLEVTNVQAPSLTVNWGLVMAVSAATPMCGLWLCVRARPRGAR